MQMFVACGVKRCDGAHGQFVRRKVAARFFKEGQRAIVRYEVFAKKFLRLGESRGKESPEPLAADFRTLAGESLNRPFRMLRRWWVDFRRDPQPVAYGGDLAEGDAGLHHAERPRVHAEKENTFATAAKFLKVRFVRCPCVIERVVNVRSGSREFQTRDGIAQFAGCEDEFGRHFSNAFSGVRRGRRESNRAVAKRKNRTGVSFLHWAGSRLKVALHFPMGVLKLASRLLTSKLFRVSY